MQKLVNTGVKLEAGLHQRLKVLSAAKARSPHWLMKAAIEEYVQREERYEQENGRIRSAGSATSSPGVRCPRPRSVLG